MGIDPVGYAARPDLSVRFIVIGLLSILFCVEGGIYLLVFCEPVDVDAGGGRIEIRADKRLISGYVETHLHSR